MESESEAQLVADEPESPEARLDAREAYALQAFRASGSPTIAPTLNAKLFALFLNGKNCEEIRRLNPQLTLGQIVDARVHGRWDQLADEHLGQLLRTTAARVQQVTLESVHFLSDVLSGAHKEHADSVARYLQTGDPVHLGAFRIKSVSDYRRTLEGLQRATGQDKKVTVNGQVTHDVQISAAKPPTVKEAREVVKALLADRNANPEK